MDHKLLINQVRPVMAINLVQEYVKERNSFLESIFESARFLKLVYSNESSKKDDIKIDRITYAWESERLKNILREFKGMYTKHESTLLNLPHQALKTELSLCKEVIKTAINVIESAPQWIMVTKAVPILKCFET